VLQALYNLSDDQAEYQLRDRFSFMRFLGLELEAQPAHEGPLRRLALVRGGRGFWPFEPKVPAEIPSR
jgi:IS5 family transposase